MLQETRERETFGDDKKEMNNGKEKWMLYKMRQKRI